MALRRGKRVNVDGKENTFTVVGDWLIDDQEEEVKQEEIKWEEVVAEFVDGKLLGADMKKKLKEEHPTVEIMYKKLIDEKCPPEVARDLCLISLYDVVVLLDDSTTMKKKQEGERIKTVQQILRLVCEVYEYTRPTGLKALRFLNEPKGRLGIKTTHIDNLDISGKFTSWNGVTRIGTELKRKILDREIFKGKGLQERERPLLVIVITDGEVEGEQEGLLEHIISATTTTLAKAENEATGKHGVNYLFAYVGNDSDAEKLLKRLNNVKSRDFREVVGCFLDVKLDVAIKKEALKWPILSKLLLGGILERWKMCDILDRDFTKENDVPSDEEDYIDISADD